MFLGDPDFYYLNPSFQLKMVLLVIALVFHYAVRQRKAYADAPAKWPAVVSLALLPGADSLSTLSRLARVADLYRDAALEFACLETIEYRGATSGRGRIQFSYIFIHENGKFRDYRTWRTGTTASTKGEEVDPANYHVPQFLESAYLWAFVFREDRQPHHSYFNLGTGEVALLAQKGITVTANTVTIGGNITVNGTGATLNKLGAGTLVISGNINPTNTGVTVTAGTLVLSGTNTFTGVTTINGGTLSVGTIGNGGVAGNLGQATSASGNIVLAGGNLKQIAEQAGVSYPTVRSRLDKVIESLRQQIAHTHEVRGTILDAVAPEDPRADEAARIIKAV